MCYLVLLGLRMNCFTNLFDKFFRELLFFDEIFDKFIDEFFDEFFDHCKLQDGSTFDLVFVYYMKNSGLLVMHFDAVVVFVTNSSLLFRLADGCVHTVLSKLIGANLEVHTLVGEVDGNGNGNVIIWKWRPTTKITVGQLYSYFASKLNSYPVSWQGLLS